MKHKYLAKRNYKELIPKILWSALVALAFLCYFAGKWYLRIYGDIGFDSILFTITSNLGGIQPGLVMEFFTGAFMPAFLWSAAVSTVLHFDPPKPVKVWKVKVFPVSKLASGLISTVLAITLLIQAGITVGMREYLFNLLSESEIFETEYVDPNSVEITFPEEKRNLIYIFLESMEVSYFSQKDGGALEENIIPELHALAEENINFSHNSGVGGFRSVSGTTWTIGAMVGQTAGVPLKTPDDVEDWQNGYGEDGEFLPGITNLSDILHENGYYQSLMVGSVCSFGGRKVYYQTHGTDTIYELSTARKDGIVPSDYFVWWGIEDQHLFRYAKQELLEIAAQEQPFAFTMLTVDTHHIGGYVCQLCGDDHEAQYENVISCSGKQVLEFVQWIQQQDFYENTTIIIVGDHPSMDNGYFEDNVSKNYVRRIYNCVINAAVEPVKTQNRQFTTLDMFPTTLAAIGCTIEGDRLGLGTNLFSNLPTLVEQMGFNRFNSQIAMSSDYYAEVFRLEEPEEE